MATSRVTFGSILSAITSAATTVNTAFDATNKGIGMITRTVTDAAEKQDVRSAYDMEIFYKTLHQDKAKELAESRKQIKDWMDDNRDHLAFYQEADQELAHLKRTRKSA